jgi:hypothetical protein
MAQAIDQAALAATHGTIVIGILGWTVADPRTVYAYYDASDGTRSRMDWTHPAVEGNVLFTVQRVTSAFEAARPNAPIFFSSSVDFPEE